MPILCALHTHIDEKLNDVSWHWIDMALRATFETAIVCDISGCEYKELSDMMREAWVNYAIVF